MTDWQGHGWARLHQHRRLLWCVHSPFTHRSQPDQSCPCDCLFVRVCFVVSFPVMGPLLQKIRSTIILFAKYNKGRSLSWRHCCEGASTANMVNGNTGTQQLAVWARLFPVCWYLFMGISAHFCAQMCVNIVFLYKYIHIYVQIEETPDS